MLLLKNYLLWCNSSTTFSKRVRFWAEQNGRTKLIKQIEMRIDKFIKTNDTKEEQLTKMMAETLVNAEGIANLAYLWDLEDSQIYLDYQDKLNQLSVERKKK